MIHRLIHRIRSHHRYVKWPIYFTEGGPPAWDCKTCLTEAHLSDVI